MTPPPALTMPPTLAFKSLTQTQLPAAAPPATGAWGPFQRAMAHGRGGRTSPPTSCPGTAPVPSAPLASPPSRISPLDYKSDSFDAQYRMGKGTAEERRWEDAVQHLKAACKLNGKEARPYRHLALAYARLDRLPEALDACRTGLNLAPDHARMRVLLGDLLAKFRQHLASHRRI